MHLDFANVLYWIKESAKADRLLPSQSPTQSWPGGYRMLAADIYWHYTRWAGKHRAPPEAPGHLQSFVRILRKDVGFAAEEQKGQTVLKFPDREAALRKLGHHPRLLINFY